MAAHRHRRADLFGTSADRRRANVLNMYLEPHRRGHGAYQNDRCRRTAWSRRWRSKFARLAVISVPLLTFAWAPAGAGSLPIAAGDYVLLYTPMKRQTATRCCRRAPRRDPGR